MILVLVLFISACPFLILFSHQEFKYGGYLCPRCQSKYCEIPTDCVTCQLTLVRLDFFILFSVPSAFCAHVCISMVGFFSSSCAFIPPFISGAQLSRILFRRTVRAFGFAVFLLKTLALSRFSVCNL
jgi:hypothetical protein